MYHDFTYEAALAASLRAQWKLDDVLAPDQELDFSRNFLPDSLARTQAIGGLSPAERRTLNQISAYQYLFLFGVFEEFVVPFVVQHLGEPPHDDQDPKASALLNFADEERKHIALFERYRQAFDRGFPVPIRLMKTGEVLPQIMQVVHPISSALFVLMFEWMTQSHYVDSVRDNTDMDPLFKSLLKHHWMEEAQHAKLDTLIVDTLVSDCPPEDHAKVMSHFVELFTFVNRGLRLQADYNVDALERAINRRITNRDVLINYLHRVALWAFVGCGLVHPRFRATVRSISPDLEARIDRSARRQFAAEIRQLESSGRASRRLRADA